MQNSRILLVDDEPNIRVLLSAILQSNGFEVQIAEDGFEALRKLRTSPPDLIISDLRMPNMNGFELLAVVRKEFPGMPIIAISGEFVGNQVEGVLADAFFQKGHYSPPDLLEKIRNLLGRHEAPPIAKPQRSSIWAPTRDGAAILTCSECLRSFPLDPCEEESTPNEARCIFCGAHLQYQLIAITKSATPP